MDDMGYINASMQVWGCVLSVIVLVCIALSRRPRGSGARTYALALIFNMGAMGFDALAYVFRGGAGDLSWWGVRVTNYCAFFCNYLLLATYLRYVTGFLDERSLSKGEGPVSRVPLHLTWVACLMGIVLLTVNLFVPVVYYIDAGNVYHRTSVFWVSMIPGLVGAGLAAGLLVRYRKVLQPHERLALWSYIFLPGMALVAGMFVYGFALLSFANTITLVIVFLFIQAEQGRLVEEQRRILAEKDAELNQSRIAIALSQIQPHFLYNALNSIRYLCKADPDTAQRAIDDFSTYLRGNLDSLKRSAPVSFDEELDHVRRYVSLESMRFDDDLTVAYDIQTTSFMIPSLTVQPLVENAVRYGVGKKEGGGTVTLSTRELSDSYEVRVVDDGVGYDPNVVQDDGRTHVGIDNVRTMLESMCHATLTIESVKGVGTTATILIPKEAQGR